MYKILLAYNIYLVYASIWSLTAAAPSDSIFRALCTNLLTYLLEMSRIIITEKEPQLSNSISARLTSQFSPCRPVNLMYLLFTNAMHAILNQLRASGGAL